MAYDIKKRDGYRQAFEQFVPAKVANFTDKKLEKLLLNPALVRNRLKIYSARNNAKRFVDIQHEFGSFSSYLWGFVNNKPIINHWKSIAELPATTELSDIISKDLKKRGFKFVGSTIIYAYMQAIGMVNDHTVDCFRHNK